MKCPKMAYNAAACRRWGNRNPTARLVNPIKKRNFYVTTMKAAALNA